MYNYRNIDDLIKEAGYSKDIENFIKSSIQNTIKYIVSISNTSEELINNAENIKFFNEDSDIALKDMYTQDDKNNGMSEQKSNINFKRHSLEETVNIILDSQRITPIVGSLLESKNFEKETSKIVDFIGEDIFTAMKHLYM